MTNLVLPSGQITNHDEITIAWSSPRTRGSRSCECIGCYAPQQPPPPITPAVAAGITRIIAESATALARFRRTASERRRSVSRSPPRIRRTAATCLKWVRSM